MMKSVENKFDIHAINTTIGVEVYFPKLQRGSKSRRLSIPTALLAAGENKVYAVFDSDGHALCGPQLKHCREYLASHRKGKLFEGKVTKVYHTFKLVGTPEETAAFRKAQSLARQIKRAKKDEWDRAVSEMFLSYGLPAEKQDGETSACVDIDELQAQFESACDACGLRASHLMWGGAK